MVLNLATRLLLVVAALASVTAFGAVPRDGLHPLALLASLLPLQLAALYWVTAAAHRSPGSKPPASD